MTRRPRYLGAPAAGREGAGVPIVVIGVAIAIGVIALVYVSIKERAMEVAQSTAESQVSAIVGPPCPTLTPAAFTARGLPNLKAFDFNGVTYTRQFGHASCNMVASKGGMGLASYPVCQFSSPAVLAVTTKRGVAYFEPGLGRKATISTPDGAPSCVMAAPYWD